MPLYSTVCPLPINRKMFRHRGSVSPIPQTQLTLWLKADAGVTTQTQFISQIVLSGAGTTTSNGTYTRNSGDTTNFTSINGNSITWEEGSPETEYIFYVYDSTTSSNTYSISIKNDQIISVNTANGDEPNPTAVKSLTPLGYTLAIGWADQSGNGNNALMYYNSRLETNQLNGKSIISFDGTSYGRFPISLTIDTSRTIFIVGKYQDINRQQEGFIALGNSEAFDLGYVFREAETGNTYYYNPGQVAAPADQDVGNYHIETVFNLYEDDSTMAFNGSFNGGVAMNAPAINEGLIATRNLFLTENAAVNIAEIIIYNKQLNETEYNQVMTYLNTKYAIY